MPRPQLLLSLPFLTRFYKTQEWKHTIDNELEIKKTQQQQLEFELK